MASQKAITRTVAGLVLIVVILVVGGGVYYYLSLLRPGVPETIDIAGIFPLSPPGAYTQGVEMRCGAELAVEEINKAGGVLGKQIRLLVYDNMGSPEKAKAAVEYAITAEKVVAVTGEYHSGCCLASMEVVHKYHIPFVVADATADEVTAKKYPEIFRIGIYSSAQIECMVAFFEEQLKAGRVKSIAIMVENIEYGQLQWKTIRPRLLEIGFKPEDIHDITVDVAVKDFVPYLLELMAIEPRVDALWTVMTTGAATTLIMKQAYELGFAPSKETPFAMVGGLPQLPEFWDLVGEAGVYSLGYADQTPQLKMLPKGDAFRVLFKERFKMEPHASTYETYDAVYALADAIERAGSTDPDKIISALEATNLEGTRFIIKFAKGPPDYFYHQTERVGYVIQAQKFQQPFEEAPIIFPHEFATGELVLPS